jgi:large subunit ribosomal protein L7/L12
MSNIENLVAELSKLTVLEAAELAKALEDHWGVTAAAPMAVAVAGGAPAAAAEEKTEFDVVLTSDGGKKLDVIKAVREVSPQLTLPQAKTLVESLPQVVKAGASKEEADKMKKALEAAGAKVELK